MPWGGRRGLDSHDGAHGPAQPTAGQLSSRERLDASPGLLAPRTRPQPSRPETPDGPSHSAILPDGPTYHLVHGDVLAVVIQPDGHLRGESKFPGEERVLWSLAWRGAARPGPARGLT